jgi:hypothetical protein
MRRAITCFAMSALVLSVILVAPLSRSATAATGTYWFHGNATDQVDKQAALTNSTAISGATFNQTPPTGLTPVTQTTTGIANEDFVGNPLTLYWHGPFTGTVSGQLVLDWWWTVPSPSGTSVSVTVFADPVYASPRSEPQKVIGRGLVSLSGAATPKEMTGAIFVSGTIQSELLIQVAAVSLVTGNGINVYYDATSTPSNFKFVDAPLPTTPTVAFDTTTSLAFAPSTTVSAHFLGAEPQTTIERTVSTSQPNRIDTNRIFVDWPLSTRTEIGQLSRSLDGGDSFRLLYDLSCAARSRPNCHTGGGGDTEDEVNLVNGDLLFADQEAVANEALASSTDHGDSWPAAREFAVSNAASGVDRQWVGWADPLLPNSVGLPIEAFLSYHVPLVGVYVQGVTTMGTPVPQPAPQLLEVNQSGNLRVDNTSGPGRGWIYVPYRKGGGYFVASAPVSGYQLPGSWSSNNVTGDTPAIFPWLNLDARGNAYAVWVTNGIVYLSVSPIDDSRNTPPAGRPATFWTPKVRVSLPAVGSAVFPAVTAGDAGRIAMTYMGSEDCAGVSDNCPDAAHWNTYAAIITDALALARAGATTTVVSGKVNHRIVHRGQVCTSGTTCSGDRSLLDMIDLGVDQTGRVGVVFMDNNNGLAANPRTNPSKAGPFVEFAKEISGPSLLAPTGTTPSTISISIPESSRADPAGDATWPNNTTSGRNLPSLDLLGASVFINNGDLVARLPLSDATSGGMARDLAAYNAVTQVGTTPADRLQYVFRFSTDEDVFHVSAEYNSDGTFRFFGGKLDANDGLSNGTSILGAGYHTDAGYPVVGTVAPGAITLRAPLSAFGLAAGSRITGANAFAMAGPAEAIEKLITNPMRTVDATPAFDATLAEQIITAGTFSCADPNIQSQGGWHEISDPRADGGSYCRDVGQAKTIDALLFSFTGSGLDLTLVKGPRGGLLGVTVDGVQRGPVNEYRAPADPAHPDNSGRKDLTFGTSAHFDVAPGQHSVRITNDSADPTRDMVYLDSITVTGGAVLTPVGHTVQEVGGMILGTALAAIDAVNMIVVDPATQLLDVVVETVAGTRVTIVDPNGKAIATASVDNGGVLDLQALPDGVGSYALVLHTSVAGDVAFTVWEKLTEAR